MCQSARRHVGRPRLYLSIYLSIYLRRAIPYRFAYVSYLSIYRSNIFNEKLQTDLETGLLALACTISYIFKELEKFEIGIRIRPQAHRVLTVACSECMYKELNGKVFDFQDKVWATTTTSSR